MRPALAWAWLREANTKRYRGICRQICHMSLIAKWGLTIQERKKEKVAESQI